MKAIFLTPVLALALGAATLSPAQPEAPRKPSSTLSAKRHSLKPDRLFRKKQLDASFMFGLVPTFVMDKATVKLPPLGVGVTCLVGNHFGFDVQLGHSVSESAKRQLNSEVQACWTNRLTYFGVRPGIHFTRKDNLDFYGGFSFGFHVARITGKGNCTDEFLREMEGHLGIERHKLTPSFGGFVGMRYALSRNLTVIGEAGFTVSFLNLGVGYRLK